MGNKPKYDDEIKFSDLLKDPIRLFGWSYIYILLIILIGGIFYVKHLNYISFNSLNPRLASDSLEIPTVVKKKGGVQLAANLDFIQNPTPDLIAKGEEIYNNTCASCHGDSGEGNGPAGLNLNPKPRNFHDKEGWTNGRKFSEMYKTLTKGIIKYGMAAYEYLPGDDRFALIHYIRSFTNDFPEITDDEVIGMEIEYNLLEGRKQPNTIPIKTAERKIADEYAPVAARTKSILSRIKNNDKLNALVAKVSKDPEKVISSILLNKLSSNFVQFKEIVSNEHIDLGFNANVLRLSENEWKILFGIFNKS